MISAITSMACKAPFRFAFCMTLLAAFIVANAQQTPAGSAPSVPKVTPGATYKIQKEDVILISLVGDQTVTTRATVAEDGTISFPYIGAIQAADKTSDQLRSLIESKLKAGKLYIDPHITVILESFHRPKVNVLGQVARSSVYEFKRGDRVLDALSMAGNVIPERADLTKSTITHKDNPNESFPLDLNALLMKGDLTQNYELQDGDTISVPEDLENRVIVMGSVARPSEIPFRENMTVLDAISQAGGERTDESKMSAVTLIRKDPNDPNYFLRYKLDLTKLSKEGNLQSNLPLRRGDVINVPRSKKLSSGEVYQYLSIAYLLRTTILNGTFFRP